MQDEVTKHTRKIFKTAKSSKHTFGEKVKEIIIEIFIIVFAVTLSIWLHGWSEHRHEQKEANKFLKELKEDLTADITVFEINKQASTRLDNDFKFILSLKKNPADDSTIFSHTNIGLLTTNYNTGRYEGFKSSGKIGTIENDKLKNKILTYYQQTIPNLISAADFMNNQHYKILDAQGERGDLSAYDFFTTQKMQGLYNLLEYNYQSAITRYAEMTKEANQIIAEIDKETKD